MRKNLDALSTELYNAVSNWNDFTELDTGEKICTESQVGEFSDGLYEHMMTYLHEEGLV